MMKLIQRLVAHLVFMVISLVVQTAYVLVTMAVVVWSLTQIKPLITIVGENFVTPDMYSKLWMSDVVNYVVGSIPAAFMLLILIIVVVMGFYFLKHFIPTLDSFWDRIPNAIKGNDIPAPKWAVKVGKRFDTWMDKKTHGAWTRN